jgi:hypothetical protein
MKESRKTLQMIIAIVLFSFKAFLILSIFSI